MDDAIALLGVLQAGLMAVLSYQARQLQLLTMKVGELCGQLSMKKGTVLQQAETLLKAAEKEMESIRRQ